MKNNFKLQITTLIILGMSLIAIGTTGCSKNRTVILNDQGKRISDLEARADLNDQINAAQNALISAGSAATSSLEARVAALESLTSQLTSDLSAESAARSAADDAEAALREAGDNATQANLDAAIAAQQFVNNSLQSQINNLSTRITQEKNSRIAGDTVLSGLLALEAIARSSGDAQNAANLNSQISAQNAINAAQDVRIAQLESDLASESAARASGDSALETLLNSSVATLQDNLDAAIAAQSNVNAYLNGRINNLTASLTATQIAQAFTNLVMQAQISSNTSSINTLNTKVAQLLARVSNTENSIATLQSQVSSLTSQVASIGNRTTALEAGLSALAARMTSAESNITGLRTDVNFLLANSVTIVDPCPSIANSEVFLRVQGKLVAFYQGTEGFLSVIGDGNYRTTDPEKVNFTVVNSQITSCSASSSTPTPTPTPSPTPTPLAGSCSILKTANYNSEQQFSFSASSMANYLSYTLEVTFSNGAVISQVNNSNGGASSYANPLWTIAPQNGQSSFNFYAQHSSTTNKPTVTLAKVKKNGQEMTCSVTN